MIFDTEAFLQFLWNEYNYQYMTDKYCQPYDDILPEEPDYGFEEWVEENLTKMQMIGHFAEYLAEIK